MNQVQPSIEHADKSLELLRTKHDNPMLKAQCLQFLGAVHFYSLCNFTTAAEHLEESLRIYIKQTLFAHFER